MISRNVKFNEEEAWDWSAQEGNYDIPPLYEEEEQARRSLQEIATPFSSHFHQLMKFQQHHTHWNA